MCALRLMILLPVLVMTAGEAPSLILRGGTPASTLAVLPLTGLLSLPPGSILLRRLSLGPEGESGTVEVQAVLREAGAGGGGEDAFPVEAERLEPQAAVVQCRCVSARNLPKKELLWGANDPYVRLRVVPVSGGPGGVMRRRAEDVLCLPLQGGAAAETEVQTNGGSNPVWNDER
jgi:hypothetical protein